MLGILIQVVLLAALMYAFARHEADISWSKLFMIFVPLFLVTSILGKVIGFAAFLIYLGCMIFALNKCFYLSWEKAILISLALVFCSEGIALGFMQLVS